MRPSSAALEASISESSSQREHDASGTPSPTPTAPPSSPSTGPGSATSATSATSTTPSTRRRSLRGASPAKGRAKRARAPGSTTHAADSGESIAGPFASYDPISCSWKTSQGSLFEAWETYSETWPVAGTMRNGRVCRRQTLERPTSDAACSSSPHAAPYPTPSAASYGSSGNGTGNNTESQGRASLETLGRTWPTPLAASSNNPDPTAHDPKRGRRLQDTAATWPTPLASDTHAKHPRSGRNRDNPRPNLTARAQTWPTPNTRDSRSSARSTTTTGVMHTGSTLTDAMRSHQDPTTEKGGSDGFAATVLNPAFVETLMGLTVGWTHVDDDVASSILATPPAHSKAPPPSPGSRSECSPGPDFPDPTPDASDEGPEGRTP